MISKPAIKYKEVHFENLPRQDYAKAKKLHELLTVGDYVKVTVNDIDEMKYYFEILSGDRLNYIIKPDQFVTNLCTVCKVS